MLELLPMSCTPIRSKIFSMGGVISNYSHQLQPHGQKSCKLLQQIRRNRSRNVALIRGVENCVRYAKMLVGVREMAQHFWTTIFHRERWKSWRISRDFARSFSPSVFGKDVGDQERRFMRSMSVFSYQFTSPLRALWLFSISAYFTTSLPFYTICQF